MRPASLTFALLILLLTTNLSAQGVLVQKDNGMLGGYHNSITDAWEESVILAPAGPCRVLEVRVFLMGTAAQRDTIWIVGDPSEGAVPPTQWVRHYNAIAPPVVVDYQGQQGWVTIDLRTQNVRIEGTQRVCVQHRFKRNGPWFGVDSDKAGTPYTSFLMNPYESSFPASYNIPGKYYLAGGDFLIRLLVEYDRPAGNTSAPPPAPTLVDVTTEAGLTAAGATIKTVQASVVDFDRDGWDDVAIGAKLFRNTRDGRFEDVSTRAALSGGATIWGDIDNDGYPDVFAAAGWGNDRIYRNNGGDGTFTDITAATGIVNNYPTMSPVWFDYDNDGRLDLFIANNRKEEAGVETYYPDQLWRNTGTGAFTNVTAASGIAAGEPAPYYDCYGAAPCDYNLDGNIDLFVANYRLAPDNLYRNNGNGTFTEVGAATGVRGVATANPSTFGHGMGCEWGDWNNDGYPDLLVGNLGHPDYRGLVSNPSLLFRSSGGSAPTFTDVHMAAGPRFYEMNAGACWLDIDNDGDLDLWHGQISYSAEGAGGEPKRRGRMYLSSGAPDYTLTDQTWVLGGDIHGPWTAVRLDYDHDGDLDLIVCSSHDGVRLLRNDIPNKGNWLAVRLTGSPADRVPADASGTRVRVHAGAKLWYRDLPGMGAGSRATQHSSELFFGLGGTTAIDSLVVTYTNGISRRITPLDINRRHLIAYDGSVTTHVADAPAALEAWTITGTQITPSALAFTLHHAEAPADLRIDLYSVLGVRVASFDARALAPGLNTIPLNIRLTPGAYLARFSTPTRTLTAKALLLR